MEDIDGNSLVLADDDDDASVDDSNYKEWNLDEDILNRLKQNDPTIKKLNVLFRSDDDSDDEEDSYDANEVDWEQEGVSAISANTHIKSLSINIMIQNEADNESNIKVLLRAVSMNRTLRHFTLNGDMIDSGDMMDLLFPCFQHNRVLSFKVDNFYLTARSASLLGNALLKGKSLRKFTLDSINGNEDDDLDELASKVVAGLESHLNLKELKLSFDIGDCIYFEDSNWCIKLGHLLQSLSKLEELNLDYSFIYDKGANALGSGLAKSTGLKKLSLRGIRSISSAGWVAIFQGLTTIVDTLTLCNNEFDDGAATAITKIKSLQSLNISYFKTNDWRSLLSPLLNSTSVLAKLDLRDSNVDDEGVTGLVDALGNNSSLRELKFDQNESITRAGFVPLIRYLGNPSSLLENVDLRTGFYSSNSSIINDELAGTLASALCTNTKLKRLDLSGNVSISPTGWQSFFDTLRNSNLSLEHLFLSGNNINDDGVTSIVNASTSCLGSLKILELVRNQLITPVGMVALATLLRRPNSLENLYVGDHDHYGEIDEVVVAFARELVNNTSLKILYLGYNNVITPRGYDVLEDLLCNKEDIESIFASNHTIQAVNLGNHSSHCPDDLSSCFELNKNENKFEVARQKIIQYHFANGEDNMQEFMGMELGVLPHALGWTGRDDTGHSVLYQLVRCLPSLFDYESRKAKATTGRKRKVGCL